MNKKLFIPIAFLIIYIFAAVVFIFSLIKVGFHWLSGVGLVLSLVMAYFKIKQIKTSKNS